MKQVNIILLQLTKVQLFKVGVKSRLESALDLKIIYV